MLELAPGRSRSSLTLAARRGALAQGAPIRTAGAEVDVGLPLERAVLRGDARARAAFGAALGVALPDRVGAASQQGSAALCLGPDEWLVLAPVGSPLLALFAEWDGPGVVIDVGHRQTTLLASGPEAATLLNAGCPLDLHVRTFPAGCCTRTLLGKAEIVLWRCGPDTFHIEVARSFAAYAWALLEEAATLLPPLRATMPI